MKGVSESIKMNVHLNFAEGQTPETILKSLISGLKFKGRREEEDKEDENYEMKLVSGKGIQLFRNGKDIGTIESVGKS